MLRSIAVAVMLLWMRLPAHADELKVVPATVEVTGPHGGKTSITSFRVIAPTPTVTGAIAAQIAGDAGVLGVVATSQRRGDGYTNDTGCEAGFATDRFVSWRCTARFFDGHSGAGHVSAGAVRIDGDKVTRVDLATLFGANAGKVAKLKGVRGESPCEMPEAKEITALFVMPQGIEAVGDAMMNGCVVEWSVLEPLLPASSKWMKDVLAGTPGPARDRSGEWGKAPARFVAQPDGVLDRVSGLVWAASDNGSDVTWDAAVAYARDRPGGWRLPTEEELEVFAQPETAHQEKGDCTKGTAYVLATPLVKLSCGLVWSSTSVDKTRAVAFGFLSGTARVSATTEKKNFRALLVR